VERWDGSSAVVDSEGRLETLPVRREKDDLRVDVPGVGPVRFVRRP
jgi:hypothetical protein